MEEEDDLRVKVRKVELASIYKKLKDGKTLNSRESAIIDDESRRNAIRKELVESMPPTPLPADGSEWGINDSKLSSPENTRKRVEGQHRRVKERKRLFLEAYVRKACNVAAACKAIGIMRGTFVDWRNNDSEFTTQLAHADESFIDFAESKLKEKITEGDEKSIIFFLKTKGKSRGYGDKIELSSDPNNPMTIRHGIDMTWLNETLPLNALTAITQKLNTINTGMNNQTPQENHPMLPQPQNVEGVVIEEESIVSFSSSSGEENGEEDADDGVFD